MSKATFDATRYNQSNNETFSTIADRHLSRRQLLGAGTGAAFASLFSGFGLMGCNSSDSEKLNVTSKHSLGFESIPGSKTDAVSIPKGYTAQILAPWGTPLNQVAGEFQNDGSNTPIDQANAMGMHHDGMHFFPINNSSTDGILCVNHEYIDSRALHPNGPTRDEATNLRVSADEVRKEINAHGVSVLRVQLVDGQWKIATNDLLNRRFTGATEMDIAGPLKGHDRLKTKYSNDGTLARGTLNNCGNGVTPWGTYLTCEENWPGYFVNTGDRSSDQVRLGVDDEDTRYGWDDVAGDATEVNDEFTRFDVTPSGTSALEDYRNEASGHGYIVEIDPYDALTKAVKRTALGRFRHEGCTYAPVVAGKPVTFYSGHDGRFEYFYKFMSTAAWDPADANATDRLAVGSKYMDEGTLYVAKYADDGTGQWLPLRLDSTTTDGGTLADHFDSLAEIILNTPGAADLVGATPMDRPEWATVDPITGTAYLCLTNNTKRNEETGTNGPNPRLKNAFGHILQWKEAESGVDFNWGIFVFGSPAADATTNLSGLSEMNQFASPDGLACDDRGILWIQTDNGADEVEEYTNDQMLAVIPSQLGDGSNNLTPIDSSNQAELRRFFVGPNGCEVTGIAMTPDKTSFFINIQHPKNWPYAEDATVATPAGKSIRPRASTVVIRRQDGGPVGE